MTGSLCPRSLGAWRGFLFNFEGSPSAFSGPEPTQSLFIWNIQSVLILFLQPVSRAPPPAIDSPPHRHNKVIHKIIPFTNIWNTNIANIILPPTKPMHSILSLFTGPISRRHPASDTSNHHRHREPERWEPSMWNITSALFSSHNYSYPQTSPLH